MTILLFLLSLIGLLGAFTAVETRRIEARYPPAGVRVEIGGGAIHVLDRAAEGEERGAVLSVFFVGFRTSPVSLSGRFVRTFIPHLKEKP